MTTIDEMRLETRLPIVISDDQGFVIYVNGCFSDVFGWKPNEIIGQALETVIPNSFHDSHRLSFSRFVVTEHARILNHPLLLKAVTKDGREIESEHFITAEKQEEGWVFGAIIRPLKSE